MCHRQIVQNVLGLQSVFNFFEKVYDIPFSGGKRSKVVELISNFKHFPKLYHHVHMSEVQKESTSKDVRKCISHLRHVHALSDGQDYVIW